MAKLTAKQQRFCDEYLIDLNGTQAAIRAGYSPKTATQAAARLLTNVKVQEYIAKRMAEKEKALIADQDEVLKYLTATMRREKKECIVVTTSEERSMYVPDDNGTMRKQTVNTLCTIASTLPCLDSVRLCGITPHCFIRWYSMLNRQWKWKKDEKTGEYLDEPVPVMDDAMAALRYGIEGWRKPRSWLF